jgi:plasmid stabilization system protein ParE
MRLTTTNLNTKALRRNFKAEVTEAARRIARYPHAWSVHRVEIRKCLLHKFPYKVLYSVEKDHVVILAVAHQHRRPDYWLDRLDS